ncbi:MAG TPA: polymer-forming cytoskeletal protein [Candidatus Acidoferrales bacterium]|nr:polymer-forming cytoskeletal protein [Candidatus Acidoferrales bacterium]
MAWKMLDRGPHEAGEWSGFLDQGVRVEGKLELPGTFRLDSRLRGSITSGEMLILGENASVEGEIDGNAVTIAGRFEGKIQARSRVEIQAKAIVRAEIHTPCLIVEPGAIVDGSCHVAIGVEGSGPVTIPIRSTVPRE